MGVWWRRSSPPRCPHAFEPWQSKVRCVPATVPASYRHRSSSEAAARTQLITSQKADAENSAWTETAAQAQQAVASLSAAGALSSFEVGNEQRFSAPRDRWAQFLELDELPLHEDWPQLFAAYRKILRWLADPAHHELTEYMLSSEARTLAEDVRPDLQFAGIAIDGVPEDSPYLESFARQLRERGPI